MTRHPIGPSGVAAKSNGPLKYSHVDMLGLRVAWLKRLRLSSAWSKSFSHMYLGKDRYTPSRMAKK